MLDTKAQNADISIYTDGAARGNPGHSASGFMIIADGKVINEESKYNGIATNNYAEYTAVVLALEWCKIHFHNHSSIAINIYSDSELVIKQLRNEYKIKSKDLKPLNEKAQTLIKGFKFIGLNNVPRENENISKVDYNLNLLLDKITSEQKFINNK